MKKPKAITSLTKTVEYMVSQDYIKRFEAEYYQTQIRFNSLYIMIDKFHAGALDFEPVTPMDVLILQLKAMDSYLRVLEARAKIEGIELDTKRYNI